MTLAAPRSRQGKAYLVLAILAVSVAIVGALLWANTAQANLPTTTITLSQTPATPGPVAPGGTVTYTMTLSTTGTNSNGAVVMTLTVDSDLDNTTVTCLPSPNGGQAWVGAGAGTSTLTCTSAAATTNVSNLVMTVTGTALGAISAPSVSNVQDADLNAINATRDGSVGDLGVGAGATANPASATNLVGTPHTITFTLLAGVTCAGDTWVNLGFAGNDTTRDCGASDVTLTPGTTSATVTAGPTVVGADMTVAGDVTVTIMGTTPGTATVALHLRYEGTTEFCISSIQGGVPCEDDDNDTALADVTATKTYETATGELCHLDIPDAASEDASGNTDGILGDPCVQDDVDDAIGSFHGACIENTNLTSADNVNITWVIQNGPGGLATVNPPGGIKYAGPNGEPCVRWGSGGTGTQSISATWDPGVVGVAPVQFFWDESDLPLIKEWNTIDSTKIISASGNVGDTLDDNTGDLDDWGSRDCVDSGFCAKANLDGTTWDISGVLFPIEGKDCPGFSGGCISASGASFIDYTMGSHNDAGGAYDGPVDGARQTYRVEGDCGSVRLEDPTTGVSHQLFPGDSETVLSSDKGVGFQIVPNADADTVTTPSNADCTPDSCVTVTIDTQEDNLFHSPPLLEANQETITVCFHVGPPTNKQPLLAWAGQRVVLEHDWGFTDDNGRSCPFASNNLGEQGGDFLVRYVKEAGNGALIDDLGHGAATGPDFMVVRVHGGGDSNTDPEGDCVSRVIYEAQDQGEQDVVAHVVFCAPVFFPGTESASVQGGPNIDPDTCTVESGQVAFLLFYMKFEDIKLVLLPDATTHGSLPSQSSTAVSAPAGATSTDANVSANVLARATVRGWVLADNCPAANVAKTGSNGEALPANRCIFPDDWRFKAGGDAAEESRPNYDIYGGQTSSCSNVAGPFSQLDAPDCGGSLAPHANGGHRETNFPNGVIDANDAPMPSALIRFQLSGSGFLLGTDKSNPTDQFDVTHIPAEPWISPINGDGSGYQWNSWGAGPKSGVYHYWTDFADHGPEVLSCAGSSSGVTATSGECDAAGDVGVPTGGYQLTRVYSDEHGVAYTWINGDANLGFGDCADNVADAGHKVVLLKGFFCQSGDEVGSSTLNALADYPDKRKHFAILSDDVSITWTWGGIKEISVVDDPEDDTGQFSYVVFHVTDRDGFCGSSPSLHAVLGEEVQFHIDSDTGVIVPNVNGDEAEGPPAVVSADNKEATTHTFDTSINSSVEDGGITVEPVVTSGECQAWIHISESLLNPINVIVTAFDPEGTVTFDTIINPTPVPTAVPTPVPTATPFTLHLKWGNTDCSQDGVTSRDSQAILKRVLEKTLLSVDEPCPSIGQTVIVGGNTQHWGNWDCDAGGVTSRDAQADLKFVLQKTALSQTDPCPEVGADVDVIPVSIP